MIEIRPSAEADALYMTLHLCGFSRDEIASVGIPPENVLGHVRQLASSHWTKVVVIDGAPAIMARSFPFTPHQRTTQFVAAECDPRKLAIGARRWAIEERGRFPGKGFVARSYSLHPARDRFMAALGMSKIDESPAFATFSDSRMVLP